MRLLLDTHALLWFLQGNERLSNTARVAIEDTHADVFVSAAVAWEIATKVRLGKLPEAVRLAGRFEETLAEQSFHPLAITVAHARRAGMLPGSHRDPFDRILAAQAEAEGMSLVTTDRLFAGFGVPTIW